ncbi:MAG: radical SAM protein [Chloroflexi bacterium]|nr:radical SAM protein [Chloroflexota bacterium]
MRKLKVLLVNPPVLVPKGLLPAFPAPLGLAHLAAALERFDFIDVSIYDCLADLSIKQELDNGMIRWGRGSYELINYIAQTNPNLLGVTCASSDQAESLHLVTDAAKKVAQAGEWNLITVAGGPHVTASYEDIMMDHSIDFCILGEGEFPLYQLCRCLVFGEPVTEVQGLVYRDYSENVNTTPMGDFIEDLDALPIPAYNMISMEKYIRGVWYGGQVVNLPYAPVFISRGCPCRCIHCMVPKIFGDIVRHRSIDNVVEEMEKLAYRYGVREFHFDSCHLLYDLNRAKVLMKRIIEKDMNISWCWHAATVPWHFDDELVNLMKRSGCYQIWLDLGCGDQTFYSDVLKRPGDLESMKGWVKKFRRKGIQVRGIFQLGWPGETRASIRRTIKFASDLKLDEARFDPVLPYPGTELFDLCVKNGYLKNGLELVDLSRGSAVIDTKMFNAKEVDWFKDWAETSFTWKYLMARPKMLLQAVFTFPISLMFRPRAFSQRARDIGRLWKERVSDRKEEF